MRAVQFINQIKRFLSRLGSLGFTAYISGTSGGNERFQGDPHDPGPPWNILKLFSNVFSQGITRAQRWPKKQSYFIYELTGSYRFFIHIYC
jgi:hypothetical protein